MEAAKVPIDLGGADGGRLAAAFAAGCIATWVFLRQLIMRPVEKALKEEHERCAAMEVRLSSRIHQLETLLLTHTSGDLRQAIQKVVSEQRNDARKDGE